MAVSYNVYRNDGTGGPVDYSTPVATATSPAATLDPPGPGDWTYAVRAFDPATGLEERNVAARARLVVGPAGEDLSAQPRPVAIASASFRSPSSLLLRWHYPDLAAPPAARFSVRVAAGGGPVDPASTPVATVATIPGRGDYLATVAAPGPGPWSASLVAESASGVGSAPLALAVATPAPIRPVDPAS